MIASLRGLVVLTAIAFGLAVLLVVARPTAPARLDRRLLGDTTKITELVFAPTGKPALTVHRREPPVSDWWIAEPSAPADPATIDALLTALRGAKWHRRAAASAAGAIRGELRVAGHTFGIGAELPGAQQTWIVSAGHALLVDNWVARALWPDPLALRIRRPFADADAAYWIRTPHVTFNGRHQRTPVDRWVAEAPFRELTDAVAALEFVSLDAATKDATDTIALEVDMSSRDEDAITARVGGTCADGGVYLVTRSTGNGCVTRAAWDRALAAFARFELPDPSVVDTHLVPFTPTTIKLTDGTRLLIGRIPTVGKDASDDQPADVMRVNELLAHLDEPARIAELPRGEPDATLVVGNERDYLNLDVYRHVIVRRGEPFALMPEAETLLALQVKASSLQDPLLWREDPSTLTSFTLRGVTYRRGAVLGEWTREPATTFDATLVDALAQALSVVRGPPAKVGAQPAEQLSVTFTPPAGQPTTHTLEVQRGCKAKVDGRGVQLELGLCTVIAAVR